MLTLFGPYSLNIRIFLKGGYIWLEIDSHLNFYKHIFSFFLTGRFQTFEPIILTCRRGNFLSFFSAYKNDFILAYHWSIKMYTGLLLNCCELAYHWSFVFFKVNFCIGTIRRFVIFFYLFTFLSFKYLSNYVQDRQTHNHPRWLH